MSMSGDEAYVLAMDYVDETLEGGGALKGDDGKSAYQSWLDLGNTGTEEDFINSLKGEKGDNGKSAYQYAKDGGYIGTETEFTTNIARSGVISKELEVERVRIDNLTTLKDGSTTGDAELIDARIDKDGNTHVNVGKHIRTVTSQLSSEIGEKTSELKETLADQTKEFFDLSGVITGFRNLFEFGNISVSSSGFGYYDSTSRVRVKKNTTISLKVGDEITIGGNISIYIGCYSDGEYTGVGWYSNQTIMLDKTGEYVFILRYPTEDTITDFDDVVSGISVYRPSNPIGTLSNDVNTLKGKTRAIYDITEKEKVLSWTQGTGTDTNPNRINAKVGYVKSTLELTPNSTLKTAVKVYSDSNYTSLVSDSSWKTDTYQQTVDGYVQLLSMSRAGETAITPTSATGVILKVLTNVLLLEENVAQNKTNIAKNTENIGNLNQTIVNNWLQSLPTGEYAGNRISQRLGYIKGSVAITDAGGIRIAVHTYTDNTYQTKVTDSNWQTTGYSENVVGYVALVACKIDYTSDIIPNDGANSVITKIENVTKRLSDMQNTIDVSIETVSSVWSYGSENSFKAIAHQGGKWVVPPCTLPATVYAKKQGFRATENDLRRTSDGVWVMWHDDDFRVIGHQEITVETSTYEELLTLDVGSHISSEFANTHICTFKEWLILCRELGLEPWIDSKQIINETYALEIFDIVKKLGMTRNVVWVGYTHKVKQYADPYAVVAILNNPSQETVEEYKEFISEGEYPKCSFDVQVTGMTQERAELAYANGYDLGCWWDNSSSTTDEQILATLKPLIAMGIQYITLNNVNIEKLLCKANVV